MEVEFDIKRNRKLKRYSKKEYLYRILWSIGEFIFRLSPRPLFFIRRFILRLYGANIGKFVNVYPSTKIAFPCNLKIGDFSCLGENVQVYNLGTVKIGEKTTISQNTHLCGGTHDYNEATMPLIKSNIEIGDNVWVCADSYIGPNVNIGNGSVVGARSVVVKDVHTNQIVAGNPAKLIKLRK